MGDSGASGEGGRLWPGWYHLGWVITLTTSVGPGAKGPSLTVCRLRGITTALGQLIGHRLCWCVPEALCHPVQEFGAHEPRHSRSDAKRSVDRAQQRKHHFAGERDARAKQQNADVAVEQVSCDACYSFGGLAEELSNTLGGSDLLVEMRAGAGHAQ